MELEPDLGRFTFEIERLLEELPAVFSDVYGAHC
jgi:hypothetical protein